jgi:integrase
MGKKKFGERIRYNIYRPKPKQRASFAILEDRISAQGKRSPAFPVKDPRINAINTQLRKGEVTLEEANEQVEELRRQLYLQLEREKGAASFSRYNRKIIRRFFDDRVEPKDLKDKRSVWNELNRTIEILGNRSLRSISKNELQLLVNKQPANRQRKIVMRLQALLKFVGRYDLELFKKRHEDRELRYLTETEFGQLIASIPSDVAAKYPLLGTKFLLAYGTGCRDSEIHGFQPTDLRSKNEAHAIFLQRQRVRKQGADPSGELVRLPKNRKKRWVVPLSEQTIAAFRQWTSASDIQKDAIRDCTSRILKTLCQKLFPEARSHGGIHMLRASHAILLLNRGLSLSQVAKQLGDSIVVVERYYSSFALTEDELKMVQTRLQGGEPVAVLVPKIQKS